MFYFKLSLKKHVSHHYMNHLWIKCGFAKQIYFVGFFLVYQPEVQINDLLIWS